MSRHQQVTEADAGTILRLVGRMVGGPKRGRAALATVMLLVSLVALIVIPTATGRGMNVIAEGGPKSDLRQWALVGVVAGAAYLLFSFVANQLFAKLASEALYELQTDLFDNVQTLSMGFFFTNSPGELSSNVTNDAEVISLFYTTALSQILRSGIQVLLIVAVMFVVNWQLALVAILTIPLLAGAAYAIAQVSGPAFNRLQETLGDVSAFQEETLSGHKVIISNNRHEWAAERHEEHVGGVYDVGHRAFMSALMQFPITQMLSLVQNVLVLVAGTFLVIDGSTTLGHRAGLRRVLRIARLSVGRDGQPDHHVAQRVSGRGSGVPDHRRAPRCPGRPRRGRLRVQGRPDRVRPRRLRVRPAQPRAARQHVRGRAGREHRHLRTDRCRQEHLDQHPHPVLRHHVREDPDRRPGPVEADTGSLRKQIGVVLQEAFLFTDTVMNNLLYANEDATEADVIEAAKKANAHDFILGLPDGYDTMLTERGANLSQGQRQMITIARAMVADPKMMILDEATSNVDTRTEKLIQDGMRKLMDDKTSFSIAHRLATIRGSNRIMVLNGGAIAEMASHDELMATKGFYHSLYMSQFKGKGPVGDPGDIALEFESS